MWQSQAVFCGGGKFEILGSYTLYCSHLYLPKFFYVDRRFELGIQERIRMGN